MTMPHPLRLAVAGLAAICIAGLPTDTAAGRVLAGDEIPRVDPFTARAASCGPESCLEISWRIQGRVSPSVAWRLTVRRPDGAVVYRGQGRAQRGRTVQGLLHPSTPPRCGRYRITLRIDDPVAGLVDAETSALRRRNCVPPRAPR